MSVCHRRSPTDWRCGDGDLVHSRDGARARRWNCPRSFSRASTTVSSPLRWDTACTAPNDSRTSGRAGWNRGRPLRQGERVGKNAAALIDVGQGVLAYTRQGVALEENRRPSRSRLDTEPSLAGSAEACRALWRGNATADSGNDTLRLRTESCGRSRRSTITRPNLSLWAEDHPQTGHRGPWSST